MKSCQLVNSSWFSGSDGAAVPLMVAYLLKVCLLYHDNKFLPATLVNKYQNLHVLVTNSRLFPHKEVSLVQTFASYHYPHTSKGEQRRLSSSSCTNHNAMYSFLNYLKTESPSHLTYQVLHKPSSVALNHRREDATGTIIVLCMYLVVDDTLRRGGSQVNNSLIIWQLVQSGPSLLC